MKSLRIVATSGMLIGAAVLSGCATTGSTETSTIPVGATASQLAMKEAELRKREAALNARAELLANRTATQTNMADANIRSGSDELPPNAASGECYARVYVEPKVETVTKKILVKEAAQRIKIVPAQYRTVTEKVLASESSKKLVIVPAEYGYVTEKVLVSPPKTKLVEVPAQYATVTEKVLVHPVRTVWKPGTGPIQKVDQGTGEIMCLVEEPALYKTVKKRVLKAPATTKKVTVPAQYKTVKKKVVKKPSTTKTIVIPAKYDTVKVTKLVAPAKEVRVPIAAQYNKVTEQKVTRPGRIEWRSILCETNTNSSKIRQIQQALKNRGYNPGAIDGVIGTDTIRAVNAFQRAKNLPVDKYLNVRTLKALGVNHR